MAGGRPQKMDDTICQEILNYVRKGIPPGTAAELAGIHRNTLYNWTKKGRESKRKNKFTKFLCNLDRAKAFAEKGFLARIMDSKDWKAQKYLLAMFDPFYRDVEKVELKHSGEVKQDVKGGVDLNVSLPKDPELRAELAELLFKLERENSKSTEPGEK